MALSIAAAIQRIKSGVSDWLSPETIRQICRDHDHQWRERILDPVTTIQLFMLQILHDHNTFTPAAIDLVVRSAEGVLRKARNLSVGCLIEAVRSANKTIDIDNVNRVLMQPHRQKETDLTDY